MTDYDRTNIPAVYDRGRDHGPEMLSLWMNAINVYLERSPTRILDLGCGTGRFCDSLAVHFNADVIGVDPSFKMLDQARLKPRSGDVRYCLARAEAIPLRSGSIDLIFMSMSLHHFSDRRQAAAECRRVLTDNGRVCVRTGTREQIPSYPYYPFFPASHPILEKVLPDAAAIRDTFEAEGFRMRKLDLIVQTIAPDWQSYVDKVATRSDSVLAELTSQDFEDGLVALRQHARRMAPQAVVEPIDLFLFSAS